MKGKRPNRLNRLRDRLLQDSPTRTEYLNQRLISELGGIISRYLEEHRVTQTALADAVGMYQPDLNALLRGRAEHVPTLATLRRLSQGLGIALAIHIDPNGVMRIERESGEQAAAAHAMENLEVMR
jgi:transcriptional regulator with XRE-family HTH domain